MGGYPTSTINIGVSFGSEYSAERRNLRAQSQQPLAWDLRQVNLTLVEAQYHSSNSSVLCRINAIGRRARLCPPLAFNGGHLEGIFQSPGSTTSVYNLIAESLGSDSLINTSTTTRSVETTIRLSHDASPMTFIPTVSAWDDDGWAYTYLSADGQEVDSVDAPFDIVMANRSGNSSDHSFISRELSTRLIHTITNTTAEPGSSFFNARGGFDTWRYTSRPTSRTLPLENQDRTATRPLGRGQIAALVALF